ncbi:MAG TPA: hypothetical protein VEL10_11770 [Gaiellaceae bacterium]|nr:hypothetical protein [Gaiellaceae bacterium]
MPPSLQEARRREAERLVRQVRKLTAETDWELERKTYRLPGDPRALRGLPAVGRDCIGGAILGTAPGSDEHLERLSAA